MDQSPLEKSTDAKIFGNRWEEIDNVYLFKSTNENLNIASGVMLNCVRMFGRKFNEKFNGLEFERFVVFKLTPEESSHG